MSTIKLGLVVGSLRKESFNRKIANAIEELAPASLSVEWLTIGNLPLYNEDIDVDPPAVYRDFREKIRSLDAFLFFTPEYNRSVPAALKNAIDVGSRPYGQNSWDGKPAGIISVSIGEIGGFGANHHLRQSMVFVNMPTMQQPEAYIGGAMGLFNDEGKLTNESTRAFLQTYLQAYESWVRTQLKQG